MRCLLLLAGLCWAAPVTAQDAPAVRALSGQTLTPPDLPDEVRDRLTRNLDSARAAHLEAIIWLGRRTAYLWRYQDAIDIFSRGLAQYPNEPHLLRHRGHRYISVRRFYRAIADLKAAAAQIEGTPDEVEPDGAPNAYNIPTSTLHTNIWYHLGLAYYLTGDFERALEAYQYCMAAAKNNDMKTATAYWLYMTHQRLGQADAAARLLEGITPEIELLENHAYHRLLLAFKGVGDLEALLENAEALDDATQGYGVGNWYLWNGETEKAAEVFEKVRTGAYWAAFGYIAAEAELDRMRRR